ncbi:NUDIX hydrolase [Achromobacter xylosoxidans]
MNHLAQILENTKEQVVNYVLEHPWQIFALGRLLTDLGKDDVSVFDRKNMAGHITTSALVVNESETHALLVHHKAYGLWLPPGGHMEPDAPSLWQSAAREVLEETGLVLTDRYLPLLDIDTHPIPARPSKNEGPHWHHDFMFLATAPDDFVPTAQECEVHAAEWRPISDLTKSSNARMRRLGEKFRERQISL